MQDNEPLFAEALDRFRSLIEQASTLGLREHMAASLATADSRGRPSVRTVLVRNFDERGFVFYTNSLSRKGRELTANPHAALCFYWDAIAQQVRIEGKVTPVSDTENDVYWRNRPRDRQLGALASQQSDKLESPELLARRYAELEREFADREVPRPAHWYGYRIEPAMIEFWNGRPARLHERIVYERLPDGWTRNYLYP